MKYVKQRGENDCGIAALAMACDMDYDDVARGLVNGGGSLIRLSEAAGEEGLNDDLVKDWLRRQDWAWQEIASNTWQRGGYVPQHPWPPSPFALTHICLVEATRNWHYCVMDFAGRVFDPWDEMRHTLVHPDYKRVATVLGLYKIGARRDRVVAPSKQLTAYQRPEGK